MNVAVLVILVVPRVVEPRHGYDLLALGDTEDEYPAGGPPGDPDFVDRGSDHHAGIGHQHQLVTVLHREAGRHAGVFAPGTADVDRGHALVAPAHGPELVGAGTLAQPVLAQRQNELLGCGQLGQPLFGQQPAATDIGAAGAFFLGAAHGVGVAYVGVALLGRGIDVVEDGHGDHAIPAFQPHAAYAGRIPARKHAHVGDREADALAALGRQQHVLVLGTDGDVDEAVALVELHRDLAIGLDRHEIAEPVTPDATAGSREHDELVFGLILVFGQGQEGGDGLTRLQRQNIDHGLAPCLRRARRQAVDLELVDHAARGEEQHRRVGVADHDLRHEVLVAGGHARTAFAAPALRAVGVQRHALDVAAMGDGHDHILARDQVFDVVVGFVVLDGGPALVAELLGHGHQLVPHQPHAQVAVGQDFEVLLDLARQLFEFAGDLVALQPGQAGELQREDAARLFFGKIVGAAVTDPAPGLVQQLDQRPDVLGRPGALHQLHPRLGRISSLPDQGDDVVDVGHGDGQPDQNVRPLARFTQLKGHAPGDHFLAEVDKGSNDLLEVQHFRPAAVDGQHVAAEGRLQRRVLEQLVEHHVGLVVALDLDHHAHAVAVGFIVGAGHALDDLVLGELHDAFDQSCLVDLIGQFGDHDGLAVLAVFLDVGLGADHHRPAAGVVGVADAAAAEDHGPGREVRPGQVLHQVVDGQSRVVDVGRAGVDHFGQVVRRDVGRHAHGNTAGAIDQQVGVGRGQNLRLLPAFVVVGLEVDRVLVDVFEQA